MQPEDTIRLRHMLDSCLEVTGFCKGKSRELFNADRMLVLSSVQCLQIIGEAASRVTETTRKSTPDIPWAVIIGMRNRLIHAYFDVNLDIVWETVHKNLPPLIMSLQKYLDQK